MRERTPPRCTLRLDEGIAAVRAHANETRRGDSRGVWGWSPHVRNAGYINIQYGWRRECRNISFISDVHTTLRQKHIKGEFQHLSVLYVSISKLNAPFKKIGETQTSARKMPIRVGSTNLLHLPRNPHWSLTLASSKHRKWSPGKTCTCPTSHKWQQRQVISFFSVSKCFGKVKEAALSLIPGKCRPTLQWLKSGSFHPIPIPAPQCGIGWNASHVVSVLLFCVFVR